MQPALPRATYRLQLHGGFGFAQAGALLPYLAALGVSHCYCSPLLRARPGSPHGYDVVDHGALNPELGSARRLRRLRRARCMRTAWACCSTSCPTTWACSAADNAWWLDVLENGQASRYADYFDIDWQPPEPALRGKVLLPVLGDQYGVVLERGELRLGFDAEPGAFALRLSRAPLPARPARRSARC